MRDRSRAGSMVGIVMGFAVALISFGALPVLGSDGRVDRRASWLYSIVAIILLLALTMISIL